MTMEANMAQENKKREQEPKKKMSNYAIMNVPQIGQQTGSLPKVQPMISFLQ